MEPRKGPGNRNHPKGRTPPPTVLFLYISTLETVGLQPCRPRNGKLVSSLGRIPGSQAPPPPQVQLPFHLQILRKDACSGAHPLAETALSACSVLGDPE